MKRDNCRGADSSALIRSIMAVGLCGLVLAAGSVQTSRAGQNDGNKSTASVIGQELDAISDSIKMGGKAESEQAAVKLRGLRKKDMTQGDRETWLQLARDTAIRNADLKWLQTLCDEAEESPLDSVYAVLLANAKLARADTAGATAVLDRMGDDCSMNPREQRRVYALRARIAQLKGNVPEERANIEKIVEHLSSWPDPMCQTCHASPIDKTKMTGLPIKELWFGERYVALMRKQGDAEAVRVESAAQLKRSRSDDNARIRQAFALQALGKSAEADKLFRELPWAQFPGRDLAQPHMLGAFP